MGVGNLILLEVLERFACCNVQTAVKIYPPEPGSASVADIRPVRSRLLLFVAAARAKTCLKQNFAIIAGGNCNTYRI